MAETFAARKATLEAAYVLSSLHVTSRAASSFLPATVCQSVKSSALREKASTSHKFHYCTSSFIRSRRFFTSASVRSSANERVFSVRNEGKSGKGGRVIRGKVFVLDDNIDTDQIIPADRLTLVPSVPEEYEQLGKHALEGLPERYPRYIGPDQMKTAYSIIVAGENFGCGSSREHAPIALGAAGCDAVVAQSYARIFFRNCAATGELYPWECVEKIWDKFQTGDEATISFDESKIINHRTGEEFELKGLGDVGPVIDAGGLFAFARQSGMIKKA
uniref:Aconitase A/isopropylmalate dehydratase small subunit swivel domain-containing protein n=1 Tax=Cyanoptyche gloeocystis TaxID=77922 RepID=A0A7S2JM40_9EUKA